MWSSGILETWWLWHINCFMQVPMQKSVVYIQLPQWPALHDNHSENCSDGGRFHNRAERFTVVQSRSLMISFGNQTLFELSYRTIRMAFDPKDLFAPHWFAARRRWYQFPCNMPHESCEFLRHCYPLVWLTKSMSHTSWLCSIREGVFCDYVNLFGFINVIHGSGDHWVSTVEGKVWGMRGWGGELHKWLMRVGYKELAVEMRQVEDNK